MVDEHYTQWNELIAGDQLYRPFLSAGDPSAATFKVEADEVVARSYCNLHGHWKG